MLTKGVSAENIIVFSYNDAAKDSENPFENKLFNKPSKGPGVDVNKGCVIDYEGSHVNPENYLAVLTKGKPSGGSGRVLESGPDDEVFLAFFDHGAPGLIAFPVKYLYAAQLLKAIDTMHTNK